MKRTVVGTVLVSVLTFLLVAGGVVACGAWPTSASPTSPELVSELPSEAVVDPKGQSAAPANAPMSAPANAPEPCSAPGFPGGDLYQVPDWDRHVCLDEVGVAAAEAAMGVGHEPGVLLLTAETEISVFVSAEGEIYEMSPIFWPRLLGETWHSDPVTLGTLVTIEFPSGLWGLGPGQEGTCPAAGFARIGKWSPGVCLGLYEADGGLVYAALEAVEMGEPGATIYVRPGETVWGTIYIASEFSEAHGYPARGATFWPRTGGMEASTVIPIEVATKVTLGGGADGAFYGLGHAPEGEETISVVDYCSTNTDQISDWSVGICGSSEVAAAVVDLGVIRGPIQGYFYISDDPEAQALHGYTAGAALYGPEGGLVEIALGVEVPLDLATGDWNLGPPVE